MRNNGLITVVMFFSILAGCSSSTNAPPSNANSLASSAAGTVLSWNAYQVTQSTVTNKPLIKVPGNYLSTFMDLLIPPAYAASTTQTWNALDPYAYDVWVTRHSTDLYVLYYGGQYYGVKKIASDGTLTTIINDTYGMSPVAIAVTDDGIYLGGNNNAEFLGVRKYNHAGEQVWTYNAPRVPDDIWVRGIAFDSNGFVYFSLSATFLTGYLYKLNPNTGEMIWNTVVGDNLITLPGYLSIINDSILLYGNAGPDSGTGRLYGSYTAKFDTQGASSGLVSLSSEAIPGSAGNIGIIANPISMTNGNTVSYASLAISGNIVIFDSNGTPTTYIRDDILNDATHNIAVDSLDNIYASGINLNADDGFYYINVHKYDQNGDLLESYSIKSFENPAQPTSALINAAGDLVIFGRTSGQSYIGDAPSGDYYFLVTIETGN